MRLRRAAVLALLPLACGGSEQASEFDSGPPIDYDATTLASPPDPVIGNSCAPGDTFDCGPCSLDCPPSGRWSYDCSSCPDCPPCSAFGAVDMLGGCAAGFQKVACGCCKPLPPPTLPCASYDGCCDAGSVLLPGTPDATTADCIPCSRIGFVVDGGHAESLAVPRNGTCPSDLIPSNGCCLPPSYLHGGVDGSAVDAGHLDAGTASSDVAPEAAPTDATSDVFDAATDVDAASDVADASTDGK